MADQMYSISALSMEQFAKRLEDERLLQPVKPFPDKELTPAATEKRKKKAREDFYYFDKTYFPPEIFDGDYAPPCKLHDAILSKSTVPGIHLIFGPRDHAKTAYAKKIFAWHLINGTVILGGTYCETLIKSNNILTDLYFIFLNNHRIQNDFKPDFIEANANQLSFRFPGDPKTRFVSAFSEGRSLRGFTRNFYRPSFLLGDDIETLESSLSQQAVQLRRDKIIESFQSLSRDATFLILGNDFSVQSALHQFRLEAEAKLLPKTHTVSVFKAFNKKPLWPERFPAKTESQFKTLIKYSSESDYQSNYQQNPVPPEGVYFTRQYYTTFESMPADLRGIIYCDPNLSKKGKGNTTAVVALAYSPKHDAYYIPSAVCRSFSDSNKLLDEVLSLKMQFPFLQAIGFDGHVTQESSWTQHIRNYTLIRQRPFPVVHYQRFDVEALAKNAQMLYVAGQLRFPKSFSGTPDGERFIQQLFAFTGRKLSALDDAPDALICAVEFIQHLNLSRKSHQPVKTVSDYY